MELERTLVILKPDAVCRALMGEIIARFERAGFTIIGAKMVKPTPDLLVQHYEEIGKLKTRKGDLVFENTMRMMLDAPVLAMVIEGVEAVEVVRKLVGSTEPKSADVGTIRADFAQVSYRYADAKGMGIRNLVHASATKEEAEKEIKLWFKDDEIFDYQTVHSAFVR